MTAQPQAALVFPRGASRRSPASGRSCRWSISCEAQPGRADDRRLAGAVHPHLPQPRRLLAGRLRRARRRRRRGAQLSRGAPVACSSHLACDLVRLCVRAGRSAAASACARPRRLLVALDARGWSSCRCNSCARLPLLAMVPLFQLWFGAYFSANRCSSPTASASSCSPATVNAVRNVPQIYIDNARSLGASRAAALSHRDPAGDPARHALGRRC